MTRRTFFKLSLPTAAFSLATLSVGGSALVSFFQHPQHDSWSPDLSLLSQFSEMDLNETLPKHMKKGGTFKIDRRAARLPEGLSLEPCGKLKLESMEEINIEGLRFIYTEPIV